MNIKEQLNTIEQQGKENAEHIKVLNEDSVKIAGEQEKIKEELYIWREKNAIELATVIADLAWLKKFFFILATASIGALVANLIQILK